MTSLVFYKNLSENLKDKIFKILLCIFFSVYILKQTVFFTNQTNFINIKHLNYFLFLLDISLIIFRLDYILKTLKRINLKNFLLTLSSILVSLLFFASPSVFFYDFIKIFIILSISLSIQKDFPKCIEIISDSICSSVLLCIFLSNILISDVLIAQGNWFKISAGFINSNLPSLFLFSSIFGYFLINKRKKLLSISIINFLLYLFFNIHSRTATLSIIIVLLGIFIKNKIFYKAISYISIILSSLYLTLFLSFGSFYDLIDSNLFFNTINKISSNRFFTLLSVDWQINTSEKIINLKNDYSIGIDSLYYELIRYLGLISIVYLVLFFLNRYYFKSYFYRPQFAVNILLISGLLEGLFYKITPMVIFLTHIILENFLIKNNFFKERNDY